MKDLLPRRPDDLDPLAVIILERLRQDSLLSEAVILGGHFATKHYVSYRTTHDIDGWWSKTLDGWRQVEALDRLREAVADVAAGEGLDWRERSTRWVVALDFLKQGQVVFSFQLAERTVELDPPRASPWSPLRIETLRDNVGAKMNALVDRGAPRDFVDIHQLVQREVVTVREAWDLWQLKNPGLDLELAKARVIRHLESIELRRPIAELPPDQRQEAEPLRRWVRDELGKGGIIDPTNDGNS